MPFSRMWWNGQKPRLAWLKTAVEDDAHAAPVGLVQQLAKGLVAAEERIHGLVVEGVIAVIRGRREDRSQIERGDASAWRSSRCSAIPSRSPP